MRFKLLLSILFFATVTHANEPLRWAADSESGAPYVFQDPRNPNRLMGFEFDLIQKIAQKTNREPVRDRQNKRYLLEILKSGKSGDTLCIPISV